MGRVVHLAGTYKHLRYFSFCGIYVFKVTLFEDEVTCKKCLNQIKKNEGSGK